MVVSISPLAWLQCHHSIRQAPICFSCLHGSMERCSSLYIPILAYILIMAVASRWHYIIDIPVGMTLAWASYKLADWSTHLPNTTPYISTPTAQQPLLTSSQPPFRQSNYV